MPLTEPSGMIATEVFNRAVAPAWSDLPLPKLMLVLAHPDDEVLAMGARLERLGASRVVTMTDGAPANGEDARHHGFPSLEAYRAARHEELLAALAHAGVAPEVAPVFRRQVPDQAASFHLTELARALAEEIERFQPDAVFTHPYEGGHPDHDACAFSVHAAVRIAAMAHGSSHRVPIFEAPFYHAGENGSMRTGTFLRGERGNTTVFELTIEERENKVARLRCFGSQTETLAQFGVDRESFRIAPAYDFTQRPHEGQLLYERFPWGVSGDQFRALATKALQELFGMKSERPRAVEGRASAV